VLHVSSSDNRELPKRAYGGNKSQWVPWDCGGGAALRATRIQYLATKTVGATGEADPVPGNKDSGL